MNLRRLTLKHDITVEAVNISDNNEIPQALTALHVGYPKTVIVLVGGAGGISFFDKFAMRKAIGIVARLAQETESVVVDGGTQAGIMTEVGKQRKQNKFSFPLIGVVVDSLLMKQEPKDILDSNHTNFFLVPGNDWGDESAWISKIATRIAGNEKSLTILVNGGEISQDDVQYSMLENRTTFIMRGTGRLADEITLTKNIIAIDISKKPEEILEILRAKL